VEADGALSCAGDCCGAGVTVGVCVKARRTVRRLTRAHKTNPFGTGILLELGIRVLIRRFFGETALQFFGKSSHPGQGENAAGRFQGTHLVQKDYFFCQRLVDAGCKRLRTALVHYARFTVIPCTVESAWKNLSSETDGRFRRLQA
jgi:hypothetical protein